MLKTLAAVSAGLVLRVLTETDEPLTMSQVVERVEPLLPEMTKEDLEEHRIETSTMVKEAISILLTYEKIGYSASPDSDDSNPPNETLSGDPPPANYK